MANQSESYFTIPVTYVDLYWVEKNAESGAEHPAQTEFPGELFFNDEVYLYSCEGCGSDTKSGFEGESGVAYCLKCVGEYVATGLARIDKRESK